MRTALCVLLILATLSAVAADPAKVPDTKPETTKPEPPPSPPPVAYEVWGYRWDGSQFVKEPTHCLKTPALQQAVDYAYEVGTFAGWYERSNVGEDLFPVIHSLYDPDVPEWAQNPTETPSTVEYTVWVFRLVKGKWVKREAATFKSPKWSECMLYIKTVKALTDFCVTTNCPTEKPKTPMEVAEDSTKTRGAHGYYPSYQYSYGYRHGESTSNDDDTWRSTQDLINSIQQQNAIQDMVNQQNQLNVDLMNAYNRNMENP